MADPEGRKRARLLKSGRTIRVTKPTLLCQRVGHSEGFCPRKNPPKAGRVGSVKAATGPLLKHETRREGSGGRTLHFDNYDSSITRRSKCQWLTLRPTKPFDHCGESRGCPRGCGTLRWRSKIAPGVSAPGHPQTNGEGAGATRLPWPVSFQNASQRPFP